MDQQSELPQIRDQLIVDLQHLPLVRKYLDDLMIRFDFNAEADRKCDDLVDEDPKLGLARLRNLTQLANPGDAPTPLTVGGELSTEWPALTDGLFQPVDLDSVLAMLRQRIAADRDGWVPVMGKNRLIDATFTSGTKPMAFQIPSLASVDEISPDVLAAPAGVSDGGEPIRIGMVDTPLRDPDPSVESDEAAATQISHGKFVQLLIQRQAPNAAITANQALDGADGRADSWDTARAMMQFIGGEHRFDILNLSLACFSPGGPPLVISRAIERLTPEVLVVAAAGNHGGFTAWIRNRSSHSLAWPAGIAQVVSVGAVDKNGRLAPFSPKRNWVSCYAQGEDVVVALPDDPEFELSVDSVLFKNDAMKWSGTSFAAATVSGAIAARMASRTPRPSAREAFEELLADRNQQIVLEEPSSTT